MEDVRAWQSRPLSAAYPILYFDALFVKSRQEGPVKYLALGINLEGEKEHKVPVPYLFPRNPRFFSFLRLHLSQKQSEVSLILKLKNSISQSQ